MRSLLEKAENRYRKIYPGSHFRHRFLIKPVSFPVHRTPQSGQTTCIPASDGAAAHYRKGYTRLHSFGNLPQMNSLVYTLPLYDLHRSRQFSHVLCRHTVRLNRDKHMVRRRQGVDNQHTKGQTAIKQNIVVVPLHAVHILTAPFPDLSRSPVPPPRWTGYGLSVQSQSLHGGV